VVTGLNCAAPAAPVDVGTAARPGRPEQDGVKIGLHIADFTYPNGPGGLADDLTRLVAAAEL
jgi:hypothetical protein